MIGHSIRIQRLYSDFNELEALHQRNGLISVIAAVGDPPERYVIGFRCRGVASIDYQDRPKIVEEHRVELGLTAEYPRIRPFIHWITPIFHPNFDDQGKVCITDWYPQQTLAELCVVLAEMIQYKNRNPTSPLNMDAAMWAIRHRNELPIDTRDLFAQPQGNIPLEPISTSIYHRNVVMGTYLPIVGSHIQTIPPHVQPGTSAAGNQPGRSGVSNQPVPFCGECGYKFVDAQAKYCPKCGIQRRSI